MLGEPFELKTDNQGLKYIFTQPHLNARQRRWLEFLSEYDFEIEYIKGKENRVADALSRRRHLMTIATFKTSFKRQVMDEQEHDPWYEQVKLTLEHDPTNPKVEGYTLDEDGLLRYNNRIYIPNSGDLREVVLSEAHNAPYSGHPGVNKLYVDLKKLYFWQGMKNDTVKYVAKCLECQRVKAKHRHPTGLL